MRFEDEVIQYLIELCKNGTFISGNVVGINESLETSDANVMVEVNDSINERTILIYKKSSVLTWKYIYLIKNKDQDALFVQPTDWTYSEFIKRIVTPVSLVLEYPQFEVWFRINNLPIVNKNEMLYCYCNEILPEHQNLIDQLAGVITIENKP
jgi:hypothetical protein